jgi:hypothetical protein
MGRAYSLNERKVLERHEGKRPLWRSGRRREYNIKINYEEI